MKEWTRLGYAGYTNEVDLQSKMGQKMLFLRPGVFHTVLLCSLGIIGCNICGRGVY